MFWLVLAKNGELKVLFSEFHFRKKKLLALLFSNWGPGTKLHTKNFEN
jgi:hypothetical protein